MRDASGEPARDASRQPARGAPGQPLRDTLEQLAARRNLSESQAADLLVRLTDPQTPPAMAGAILGALRTKGVVPDEVRGFAIAMRGLARRPNVPVGLPAIDVVGTGGDSSASLNISTGTALLTAACEVPVLKHGNRSVSSRTGSADVLEALGLSVPLEEHATGECLAASHFTFLFAPHYHPAMKAVAPVRAALGVRTIFNILGPLTNPAQPPFHLIGAFSLEIAQLMAQTLSGMNVERTFVVHGAEGWDEPTPVGPFTVFDVRPGSVIQQTRQPEDYGLARCTAAALAGGDASYNASALQAVLRGEDRGPHRNCLLLGTALALEVVGRVRSPREGVECAAAAIDGGAGGRTLDALARFAAAPGASASGASASGASASGASAPATSAPEASAGSGRER